MEEIRSSVRFPIKLPVAVRDQSEHHSAHTQDISSGGVLFQVESEIAIGAVITFSIEMPGSVLGTPSDVKINCVGRVVRCVEENGRRMVAAVIDEYRFERIEAAAEGEF